MERTDRYARNELLEGLLKELGALLSTCDARRRAPYPAPKTPVTLVVGCGRSGTTMMMQILAASGAFGYPSNVISRFHAAPYVGALVHRMLYDRAFSYKAEMADLEPFSWASDWKTDVGKTRGGAAPNVFWYFWRRFFPDQDHQFFTAEALARVDREGFLAGLAALEQGLQKPLALKGMFVNWNLPFLDEMLDKALFVFMRRHPLFTVQSILEVREKMFGDRRAWWSFRPPELAGTAAMDPLVEVTRQVFHTNAAVEDGLARLEPVRVLELSYEQCCADPAQALTHVREKLMGQGCEIVAEYAGPRAFPERNELRLPDHECQMVCDLYGELSGTRIAIPGS
jgi:LPS sulfotransferase NodH